MNLNVFVDTCVLFGAFLSFLMGMGQGLLVKKDFKNHLFIWCCFFIGLYQLSLCFNLFSRLDNWFALFRYLYILGMTSLYLATALAYMFFTSLPKAKLSLSPITVLLLALPVLVAALLLCLGEFPMDEHVLPGDYLSYIYHRDRVVWLVDNLSIILVLACFIRILIQYRNLYRNSSHGNRKNFIAVGIFSLIALFFALLYYLYYNNSGFLHHVFKLRFTFLVVYLFLFSYRYPFLANIIKLEAYRDYYIKSKIENIRTEDILTALDELMTGQKLYLEGDLTLKKAAGKVGVSPHQLSEIINTRLGTTFRDYLRDKRLAHSQRLLLEEPLKNILDVSLDSGFNSISNFNTAFKQLTGLSPSQYRKKFGSAG